MYLTVRSTTSPPCTSYSSMIGNTIMIKINWNYLILPQHAGWLPNFSFLSTVKLTPQLNTKYCLTWADNQKAISQCTKWKVFPGKCTSLHSPKLNMHMNINMRYLWNAFFGSHGLSKPKLRTHPFIFWKHDFFSSTSDPIEDSERLASEWSPDMTSYQKGRNTDNNSGPRVEKHEVLHTRSHAHHDLFNMMLK